MSSTFESEKEDIYGPFAGKLRRILLSYRERRGEGCVAEGSSMIEPWWRVSC